MDATTKKAIEMAQALGLVEIIDTDKGAVMVFETADGAETFQYRAQSAFRSKMDFRQCLAEPTDVYVRWF